MQNPPPGHTVTGPPAARRAVHAARPPVRPARLVAGVAAFAALLAALGVGTAACLTTLAPATSTPTSARSITVTPDAGQGMTPGR